MNLGRLLTVSHRDANFTPIGVYIVQCVLTLVTAKMLLK